MVGFQFDDYFFLLGCRSGVLLFEYGVTFLQGQLHQVVAIIVVYDALEGLLGLQVIASGMEYVGPQDKGLG